MKIVVNAASKTIKLVFLVRSLRLELYPKSVLSLLAKISTPDWTLLVAASVDYCPVSLRDEHQLDALVEELRTSLCQGVISSP